MCHDSILPSKRWSLHETQGESLALGTHTYVTTPQGLRVAAFYTKLATRVLGPLLAADQPPAPIEVRRALATLDRAVGDYVTNARLGAAA